MNTLLARAGWIALFGFVGACATPEEATVGEAESDVSRQPAVLEVPLLLTDGNLVSTYNAALKKAGMGIAAYTIQFADSCMSEALAEFEDTANDVLDLGRLRAGNADSSKPLEAVLVGAGLNDFKRDSGPSVCFRGDARGVQGLLDQMGGTVFTTHFTAWAWRYKNETFVNEDLADAELPREWATFDTSRSDQVLIVSDDGAGDQASLIPRCK